MSYDDYRLTGNVLDDRETVERAKNDPNLTDAQKKAIEDEHVWRNLDYTTWYSGNNSSGYTSSYTPSSGSSSSGSSSSARYTSSYSSAKSASSSRGRAWKVVCVLLLLVVAFAAIFFVSWGVYNVVSNNNKIDDVEALISNLPENISDYSYFDQEIMDAYSAYMELDSKLQNRVENADKLLACMDGFNLYRVDLIKRELKAVTKDSVQNTDVLERLNKLRTELTNEQRVLLTADENSALEQASYAYATINGINELLNDVVGKYDTISEIKKNYIKLTDSYKSLVYNYSVLDTIEEVYNLQKALIFTEDSGGWAVSVNADSRSSLSGDIVIPSEHKGQPVTTIPESAFFGCTGITSITVPDSVTSIGTKAFSGCINLRSITLPFVGASRSASGSEGVFGYIFGKDSYSGGLETKQFYKRDFSHVHYIPSQLKEVTITDAVQLGYGAFYNCSMLTKINLNDEIVGVAERTFLNCSGITTINIPGITIISESMFAGCSSLTSLTLSDSVMEIGENAFKGCLNLAYLNSVTEGEFIIGDSVQSIGKGAFNGCIHLQSITLPFVGASRSAYDTGGVFGYIFGEDPYSGGFETCQDFKKYFSYTYYIPSQLKEVTITDAIQLGYGAFSNCSMLTKLTINSGAKNSIGDKAFEKCVKAKWE